MLKWSLVVQMQYFSSNDLRNSPIISIQINSLWVLSAIEVLVSTDLGLLWMQLGQDLQIFYAARSRYILF